MLLFSADDITGGVAICKDLDFPQWIRQYGQAGIEVLFVPAWDLRTDAWLHVIPATDHASNVGASLGLGNRRWAQVNAFEVNTGDIVFTDPGCVICGRQFEECDDLVMRVIKTHDGPQGRRTRTVPAHYGCR